MEHAAYHMVPESQVTIRCFCVSNPKPSRLEKLNPAVNKLNVTRFQACTCAGKETSFIHAPSHNAKLLDRQFATLKEAGAHGVMLDVWCATLYAQSVLLFPKFRT